MTNREKLKAEIKLVIEDDNMDQASINDFVDWSINDFVDWSRSLSVPID